jgi:pimeloyl-ACP methyl ester carboxylesterase
MSHSPHHPSLGSVVREAVAFARPTPTLDLTPLIEAAPRGDGHTVLVLPATLRGDGYTAEVRSFLAAIGYRPEGWRIGVNLGPTPRLLSGAADRLADLAREHGPVSLVGFSMGGLFARWLAQRSPTQVRRVITVCSPFRAPIESLAVSLEPFLGWWPGVDLRALAEAVGRPLAVPATSVWSRIDGIVDAAACRDPDAAAADNVEIACAHVLIAQDPAVLRILADRLIQPSGG